MSKAKENSQIVSKLLSDVGSLVTADSDSLELLSPGTDGQVLTADSTQPKGIKWATAGTSGLSAGQITDLTDSGESTLHYHASDRNLTNATGTLAVANGGTASTTAQTAINILTNVAATVAGNVLTKVGSDAAWATPSGAGIGDVSGPASAVSSNVAAFDGTTGKLIKDGGILTTSIATKAGVETLTNKTLSTGSTWSGNAVGALSGGTAQSSWVKGDILYSSAANTLTKLPVGATGQVLAVSNAGIPSWKEPHNLGGTTLADVTITYAAPMVNISETNPNGWNTGAGRMSVSFEVVPNNYFAANPNGHAVIVLRNDTALLTPTVIGITGQGAIFGRLDTSVQNSPLFPTSLVETFYQGGNFVWGLSDGERASPMKDGVRYKMTIDATKTDDGHRYIRYRRWHQQTISAPYFRPAPYDVFWELDVDTGDILDHNIWADLTKSGLSFFHVIGSNLVPGWSINFTNIKVTWGPAEQATSDLTSKKATSVSIGSGSAIDRPYENIVVTGGTDGWPDRTTPENSLLKIGLGTSASPRNAVAGDAPTGIFMQNYVNPTFTGDPAAYYVGGANFDTIVQGGIGGCTSFAATAYKMPGTYAGDVGIIGGRIGADARDATHYGGIITGFWAFVHGDRFGTSGIAPGIEINSFCNQSWNTTSNYSIDPFVTNGKRSVQGLLINNYQHAIGEYGGTAGDYQNTFGIALTSLTNSTRAFGYQTGLYLSDCSKENIRIRGGVYGTASKSDYGIKFEGNSMNIAAIALADNKFNWGASSQAASNEGDMLYNATSNILYFNQGGSVKEILACSGVGTSGSYIGDRKAAVNIGGVTYYMILSTTP